MVFPLSNSGFNPMGADGMPAVTNGVEPMGEMILPGYGSGVDPFGFTNPQVSMATEPGLMSMGWGTGPKPAVASASQPQGAGINGMAFPMPGATGYGMPGYCAPPSGGPGGHSSSLSQASALLDFMKGIFSGIMFGKLSHQMFPGSAGAESEQNEGPEVAEESPPSSGTGHQGSGTPGHSQAA